MLHIKPAALLYFIHNRVQPNNLSIKFLFIKNWFESHSWTIQKPRQNEVKLEGHQEEEK